MTRQISVAVVRSNTVKRISNLLIIAAVLASATLALVSANRAYRTVVQQRVNRKFCQVRSEISAQNLRLRFETNELKSRRLISGIVQPKIEEPYCRKIASSIEHEWSSHVGSLGRENREIMDQVVAGGGASCLAVLECESLPPESKLESLVTAALEPLPDGVWEQDWVDLERTSRALKNLSDRAEVARLRDLAILCSLARDRQQSANRLAYYTKKCGNCDLAQSRD